MLTWIKFLHRHSRQVLARGDSTCLNLIFKGLEAGPSKTTLLKQVLICYQYCQKTSTPRKLDVKVGHGHLI